TMSPTSVLLFLLQLCCLQMMLVSMPTCKLPGKMVRDTHNLYDLTQTSSQSQSWVLLSLTVIGSLQCRWSSLVVYECLREANLIFTEYDVPEGDGGLTWSQQKLEDYQNLQDRLVEENQCVSIRASASAVLSPFFRNVTAVVEQQDGSACGWEILRSDLLQVLKLALHKHHGCFNWTRAH
uniref:Uncharacterized protein n=1 Tax=Xiphophorus maculatus TaxID=8083 RepID=A0A3B5RA26_XIPMA